MAKYCKGGNLVPEGATQWPIPALPGGEGEQQCIASGGTVVEEGSTGGCGSAASAQKNLGAGNPGLQGVVDGAFVAALQLRESLAGSPAVRELDVINEAEELPGVIAGNDAISERLAQAVGMASSLAVDLLKGGGGPGAAIPYSEGLHDWLSGLASDVRGEVADDDVKAAIDSFVERLGSHVGTPIGDVYRSMRGEAAGA